MTTEFINLTPEKTAHVKSVLLGLMHTLKAKRGLGAEHSGLSTDEEIILQSLSHPERGDVKIMLANLDNRDQVFISNRRDPSSPFSVMDKDLIRLYPGRRSVDGVTKQTLIDGQFALFIITITDREYLRMNESTIDQFFSVHLGIHDDMDQKSHTVNDYMLRSVDNWSMDEKLDSLNRLDWGDPKILAVEKELFGFSLAFAKYKQKSAEELVVLSPRKPVERISQLIRDIYPYNVRVVLRRDFPKEHAAKLEETREVLRNLITIITERSSNAKNPEYKSILSGFTVAIKEILEKDPDFQRSGL